MLWLRFAGGADPVRSFVSSLILLSKVGLIATHVKFRRAAASSRGLPQFRPGPSPFLRCPPVVDAGRAGLRAIGEGRKQIGQLRVAVLLHELRPAVAPAPAARRMSQFSQKNAPCPIQYASAWVSCDTRARFDRSIIVWSIGLL